MNIAKATWAGNKTPAEGGRNEMIYIKPWAKGKIHITLDLDSLYTYCNLGQNIPFSALVTKEREPMCITCLRQTKHLREISL